MILSSFGGQKRGRVFDFCSAFCFSRPVEKGAGQGGGSGDRGRHYRGGHGEEDRGRKGTGLMCPGTGATARSTKGGGEHSRHHA